jgi:hypothetical protein
MLTLSLMAKSTLGDARSILMRLAEGIQRFLTNATCGGANAPGERTDRALTAQVLSHHGHRLVTQAKAA